eukprot:scaffold133198_cov45-Tisochrysis_lutea.AAC.1
MSMVDTATTGSRRAHGGINRAPQASFEVSATELTHVKIEPLDSMCVINSSQREKKSEKQKRRLEERVDLERFWMPVTSWGGGTKVGRWPRGAVEAS